MMFEFSQALELIGLLTIGCLILSPLLLWLLARETQS